MDVEGFDRLKPNGQTDGATAVPHQGAAEPASPGCQRRPLGGDAEGGAGATFQYRYVLAL